MTETPLGKKFIDSNIFIYAYDSENEAKRRIARQVLAKHWGNAAVSIQTLAETYSVLTGKKRIPSQTALEILFEIKDGFDVIHYEWKEVVTAAKIHQKHGTYFWDALIAATACKAGATILITEDENDFSKVPGIQVENPFPTSKT